MGITFRGTCSFASSEDVLPLEEMDLIADPVHRRLTGAHSEEWVRYIR